MHQQTPTAMHSEALRLNATGFLYRGIVKNVLDSTLALFAFIILSPLFILIAIRMKKDSPGPILVKQKCEGLKGHPFNIYKFRTHELVETGSFHGKKYVLSETYVGKVLREANLENLPQLFNVFIGDMSLVGPRPNPINMTINNVDVKEIVPSYEVRSLVKPGMTGWARVNGFCGPTRTFKDATQRDRFDMDYLRKASFRFDWHIIFKTLPLIKLA